MTKDNKGKKILTKPWSRALIETLRSKYYADTENGILYWNTDGKTHKRGDVIKGSLMNPPPKQYLGFLLTYYEEDGRKVRKAMKIHQVIWFFHTGKQATLHLDHRDGDPFNNAYSNLREATNSQNQCNMVSRKERKCGENYKGVTKRRNRVEGKLYWATIVHQGKQHYLGSFYTEEEAARAYDKAARELHGEFAYLNFPDEVLES